MTCLLGCWDVRSRKNFYQATQCNIPEDNHLHTCRRENLKSQLTLCLNLNLVNINEIYVFKAYM
jgi:hypothetical protein